MRQPQILESHHDWSIERFFNKIKHYRAIATRFDKLANTFLTGVLLVCVVLWLN